MKRMIISISLGAAVAFLGLSIVATWQIFQILLEVDSAVRGELWIFLILSFTGGVILLSMAWGIAEISDRRQNPLPEIDDE